jgi:hypothetical protein
MLSAENMRDRVKGRCHREFVPVEQDLFPFRRTEALPKVFRARVYLRLMRTRPEPILECPLEYPSRWFRVLHVDRRKQLKDTRG